jgi:hypothetical protein
MGERLRDSGDDEVIRMGSPTNPNDDRIVENDASSDYDVSAANRDRRVGRFLIDKSSRPASSAVQIEELENLIEKEKRDNPGTETANLVAYMQMLEFIKVRENYDNHQENHEDYEDHQEKSYHRVELDKYGSEYIFPDDRGELKLDEKLFERLEIDRDRLVARITAGTGDDYKRFYIIDNREAGMATDADFSIIGEEYDDDELIGLIDIQKYKPVTIGRSHHRDDFIYPATMSRDHFRVVYDDYALAIQNLNPTNRTVVEYCGNQEDDEQDIYFEESDPVRDRLFNPVDISRTINIEEMMSIRERQSHEPGISRRSRGVIGRVNRDFSDSGSIAFVRVVDNETLNDCYESTMKSIVRNGKYHDSMDILEKVMTDVWDRDKNRGYLKYDSDKQTRIEQHYMDKYGEVELSDFVKLGAGVCSSQALLAGYIIDKLIRDGTLSGTVGIERNGNEIQESGIHEGNHQWAVFRPTDELDFEGNIIIDPAQQFVGTKKEADEYAYNHPKAWMWNYDIDYSG